MDDPRDECDSLGKQNLDLQQTDLPPLAQSGSQGGPVLEQPLKQFQGNALKYKHLFEMAPDAILVADAETGILLEANKKAAKLLGIPVDRITGMHQSQLHPTEEREFGRKLFQEHVQKKVIHCSEDVYICNRDGEKIPVQINTSVIQVDNRKIVFGIFRDMTEQQEICGQIKTSEEQYKRLSEASFEGVLFHENGIIIKSNQQFADMFGYSLDEIKGMNGFDLFAPESREIAREKIASGDAGPYEATCLRKDGSTFPVDIRARSSQLEGQNTRVEVVRDLTELKEAQQKIISLAKFPSENPNPVFRISKDGFVMYANAAGTRLLSELGGGTEQKTPKEWETVLVKAVSSHNPTSVEIKHAERTLLFFFIPLPEGGYLNLYVRDITEQKRLERQLIENEKRYRELYRRAQIALYRTRVSDGKMLDCSLTTSTLLGYTDEAEFLNLSSVTETYVDPQQRKLLLEALRKNKRVEDFHIQLKRKDGTHIWVSTSAEIFPEQDYLEGVMVDITASKVLSKAEKKVLELILQGKSNKEIAFIKERSVRTIEDHRANVMTKLEVSNLVELTQAAINFPNHHNGQSFR